MDSPHSIFLAVPASQSQSGVRVSPLRELLGDRAVQFIYVLPERLAMSDVSRLSTLFPEAKIPWPIPSHSENVWLEIPPNMCLMWSFIPREIYR